jgi:hypothetical protein
MFDFRRTRKCSPRLLRAIRVPVESLERRFLLSAAAAGRHRKPPASSSHDIHATGSIIAATLPATAPANTVAGMDYEYYQGTWSSLPNFSSLTPIKGGLASDFSLSNRNSDSDFAFAFTGYVDVPTTGSYTFYTTSVDGSSLSIDGTKVVNNDGVHGAQTASGSVSLAARASASK